MDRLKDNALKKYEFFSGFKLDFDEPLFGEVELRREVAVPVSIRGSKLIFIGSMWKTLIKEDMRDHEDFYYFLMETGLGEKNSLGFGFINPVRSSGS
jgi:CRISPR-associated endoribonuclease Cas6